MSVPAPVTTTFTAVINGTDRTTTTGIVAMVATPHSALMSSTSMISNHNYWNNTISKKKPLNSAVSDNPITFTSVKNVNQQGITNEEVPVTSTKTSINLSSSFMSATNQGIKDTVSRDNNDQSVDNQSGTKTVAASLTGSTSYPSSRSDFNNDGTPVLKTDIQQYPTAGGSHANSPAATAKQNIIATSKTFNFPSVASIPPYEGTGSFNQQWRLTTLLTIVLFTIF
ncbi:hypothetical protein MOUN0_F03334 [Monosporozyma unispora]